tara:strand:- start:224 stop:799 length:576 start_codon:yes stop_codon:yes gene_type:complete
MKTEKIKISKIKRNPNNPRLIKDNKFHKLVKSIKEFPEMLDIRPIVVNEEMVVLGGNMRLKACQEAGLKEVPIMKANELTAEQQREFIVKDNVGFGEWDWDMVANEWDNGLLNEWGLDVWQPEKEIDYSILNEIDLDEEVNNMYQQTKKSIILEYPTELYENEVKEVYESLKKNNVDISNILLQAMQNYNS